MKSNNHIPKAVYGDPGLAEYRENPFISALPPIYDEVAVTRKLRSYPSITPEELSLKGNIRVHAIARLLHNFFQPLSHHLQLESKISLMIRQGYIGRSPKTADFNKHLQNSYERIVKGDLGAFIFQDVKSTASDMSLFGCSGCGKTSTINRILASYPQVIDHPRYKITQIVYLKLDCPPNGDLTELCHNFFVAVDSILQSNYSHTHGKRKQGISKLLANMCHIASLHALGLLVIDEVQNLSEARSGGAKKMQNFFVSMVNTIGVPIFQIGTYKAKYLFQGSFRGARRVTGFGSLLWDRLPKNEIWTQLVKVLWQYQWLQNKTRFTSEIEDRLYELSQGVMDIVIKLFVLAQARAIAIKLEKITPDLLTAIYQDELKPVHPMLDALRSNDPERIAEFDDLVLPDIEYRLLTMVETLTPLPTNIADEKPIINPDKRKTLLSITKQMGIAVDIAEPMIDELLFLHPELSIPALINRLTLHSIPAKVNIDDKKQNTIKLVDWGTLASDDLRCIYSTKGDNTMHQQLEAQGIVFDLVGYLAENQL